MTVRRRERVLPEWVDYNGHLSEAYYVLLFGHATDAVMDAIGLDAVHRDRTGASLFTAEAHVRYLAQVREGDLVETRSSILGAGPKVLWIWHEMTCEGSVRATEEILAVQVDAASGRATPFSEDMARTIDALRGPLPEAAGRRITLTG